MSYDVQFSHRAARKFRALPRQAQEQLTPLIASLAENPRPPGATNFSELPGGYRVRSGDFRIVYAVRDKQLLMLVLSVGDRKSIYDNKEVSAMRRHLKSWAP